MAPDASPRRETEHGVASHELPRLLAGHGFPLNSTLVEMLGEHFSHRTERRGCGFTQATRHLAALVNRPRSAGHDAVALLFAEHEPGALALQRVLRSLPAQLEREESRILANLIGDLVVPAGVASGEQELPAYFGEIKVGTCPLAEKYFLEISDRFVRRKGRVNVVVSEAGEPLLIEKVNLGDNHSCVNVTGLMLNGVRLPPGCLLAVRYAEDVAGQANCKLPGCVIAVRRCIGFRFLRLTTLAVSPQNRQRAFSSHFQSQVDAGLFAPGEATIEQLRRVAEEQL